MARSKLVEKTNFNFETALEELDQLVEKMEKGDLSLEASLSSFEHGVALVKNCQAALKAAEQKVQILIQNQDKSNLKKFDKESDSLC